MRDALNSTGRPIWFALCGWEPFYASAADAGNTLANSARIGPDTGSGWLAVLKNVDNTKGIGQFAGRAPHGGYWNDGSLQLSVGVGCTASATCMTPVRHRSMFSLWCVLGLNLVMTGVCVARSPVSTS
jgi:alpha-galactosidase